MPYKVLLVLKYIGTHLSRSEHYWLQIKDLINGHCWITKDQRLLQLQFSDQPPQFLKKKKKNSFYQRQWLGCDQKCNFLEWLSLWKGSSALWFRTGNHTFFLRCIWKCEWSDLTRTNQSFFFLWWWRPSQTGYDPNMKNKCIFLFHTIFTWSMCSYMKVESAKTGSRKTLLRLDSPSLLHNICSAPR